MLAKIFPGGAGAGGHNNSGKPHGGSGGGIIIITADSIIINSTGLISSNGSDGYPIGGDGGAWGSGGGAGGSIYLSAAIMNINTGRVYANGGIAFDGSNGIGHGGDGGQGRIRLDYATITGSVISPIPYVGTVDYYDSTYLMNDIY